MMPCISDSHIPARLRAMAPPRIPDARCRTPFVALFFLVPRCARWRSRFNIIAGELMQMEWQLRCQLKEADSKGLSEPVGRPNSGNC
jgi:hypothetical protein